MSYPRPRHDVYDDTRYARRAAPRPHRDARRAPQRHRPESSLARAPQPPPADRAYNAPVHYPQPGEQSLPRGAARRAHNELAADMRAELARAERDFGPLFAAGAGLFSGLLSSFDRVFDDAHAAHGLFDERRARGDPDGGGGEGARSSSSSFFYESRHTTVAPDGRVREETVRTVPGPDGRPRTTRNVREGSQPHWQRDRSAVDGAPAPPQRPGEPDVVVEELDEHGNVISSNARPAYPQPRLEHDHAHGGYARPAPRETPPSGSWLHDRYQQWRGNRV